MAGARTKWERVRQEWQDEGAQGLALWAVDWTLWKTRFYYALSGPQAEELQGRIRKARRVKKYGIENPIIVYQMGKVGSMTMVLSFEAMRLSVPVYHLHFLNDTDKIASWLKETLRVYDRDLEMVALAEKLKREIDQGKAPRYNLVCTVRAPVPRTISSFFNHVDSFFPDFRNRFESQTLSMAELIDYFLNEFQDLTPNNWFERQVHDVFGIDVYAEPFARERGYQIYENAKARLLVLRLEDLNRVAGRAMQEFLDMPDFKILPTNLAEKKKYGAVYKEFLAELRLPKEYVERTHGTRYAQQFYTPEELTASIARWV